MIQEDNMLAHFGFQNNDVVEDARSSTMWRRDLSRHGTLQPTQDDVFSQKCLSSICGVKAILSELFCPRRITAQTRRPHNEFFTPGFAFDIVVNDTGDCQSLDFNVLAKRQKFTEILCKQRLCVFIGSPKCTAFSIWQFVNDAKRGYTAAAKLAKAKAIQHMNFAASFYVEQIQAGGYFLNEHPRLASEWKLQAMEN